MDGPSALFSKGVIPASTLYKSKLYLTFRQSDIKIRYLKRVERAGKIEKDRGTEGCGQDLTEHPAQHLMIVAFYMTYKL